ncbi:AFR666Cp [Eremothecium gossypii ATCC 10895]|uniref:1-phosphatidylinositol 4-kinase n=1 Tax=Eremothecium gossypii (strain ATCC 10895 / CBS 109.51 / FGSC 9923 / NRRL Y-1056) TaxID=284811 RepID=Q752A9_EREGS|nr:AFR666Cp [Eremothecium gossypii ATCC 10895]AAS54038.2 AFR666Cp [Eremothecium gossypii ATCC 10895]AEY98353.1 FAFR666Cp [Eremothecium gossypii FDAG1]
MSKEVSSTEVGSSQDELQASVVPGSNELLLKFINSAHFTLYHNIEYLTRYAGNVGIHFHICQKLLSFPHNELQFYIPQLVQVLLTVETESMALEDLLMKLSGENPHFALLTYWQLHALLSDLATDPASYGFQVARRMINKLQVVLCSTSSIPQETKVHENLSPSLVLASMVMSSIAFPQLAVSAKPLVESQGKRQRSHVFKLAKNAIGNLGKNISLKNTVTGRRPGSNKKTTGSAVDLVDVKTKEDTQFKKQKEKDIPSLNFDMVDNVGDHLLEDKLSSSIVLPKRRQKNTDQSYMHRIYKPKDNDGAKLEEYTNSMPNLHLNSRSSTSLHSYKDQQSLEQHGSGSITQSPSNDLKKSHKRKTSRHGANIYNLEPSSLSATHKIKILKANYFRCEMQFVIALETISRKLAQVPTEARLTSLRAELSIMNRDLPAEVDIPTLLPPNKKGKLHRIVNIAANEAQVLNSAEKVPFLLYIEYLRDDMDFDPATEKNDSLLKVKPDDGSFIFDLSNLDNNDNQDIMCDSNLSCGAISEPGTPTIRKEIDLGDLSMVKITDQSDMDTNRREMLLNTAETVPKISSNSVSRNSELSFISNLDEMTQRFMGVEGGEPPNFSDDLATQMRISAMMLAQLDKSPQQLSDTTNQIRAKIIASMQEAQDRFGYYDLESVHGMAGERKFENDLKTGGIYPTDRKNTTYLGEDWNTKKEKIRSASQYGQHENWDLFSVIAKSGDDLRQEAFACQLIQAMANIWNKEKVDVWVKKMKILITSANTGLVETITNAISVHSIKKSLTKQMIEEGELNEKGTIATLCDHFSRSFGEPNSFRYKRAQDNFASSLAAYSLICYILQIKDRHNGNIMIDNEGHLVHIDFGFMLSNSPGSVGFEAAPFKLTQEYVDVLGGIEGEPYKKFIRVLKEAFRALRKHADMFVSMCEVMQKDNMQPCFNAGEQTSIQLRQRFHTELAEDECDDFVENVLVAKSLGSIYTRLYDQFQLMTQGICT